jgi:hypothetical protein
LDAVSFSHYHIVFWVTNSFFTQKVLLELLKGWCWVHLRDATCIETISLQCLRLLLQRFTAVHSFEFRLHSWK